MSFKITREFLDSLSEEDINFIRSYIEERFGKNSKKRKSAESKQANKPASSDQKPPCPVCGGSHVIKWGFNNGSQRYKCKDCGKLFNRHTGTLLESLHCSEETLLKVIDAEIRGDSLKEIVYQTGLTESTCFLVRQRLHALAGIVVSGKKLTGQTEVDATYTKISLSGTKPENMPRYSKKRGKHQHIVGEEKDLRGPSHHKICIITAIDEQDKIIYKVSGLGQESLEKYQQIREQMTDVKMIISDHCSSIVNFASEIGAVSDHLEHTNGEKHYTTPLGNSLGDVNQLHQELKDLIRASHGISTRHLQGYLDWLVYTKGLRYSTERKDQAVKVYEDLKSVYGYFRCKDVHSSEQPVSLREAYEEYHYGIFAD